MSKNKTIVLATALLGLVLGGCEKDETDNISKVFTVPTIILNGEKAVSVPVGSTYTDPGAKYVGETGEQVDLQSTSSNVNTAQPGLYIVQYEKTSASGIYETYEERIVVVTSVNNPIDYSGAYLRAATGVNAFVTKVDNGLYEVQNPGGAAVGANTTIYFGEIAPNTFVAPTQVTQEGEMEVTDIKFTLSDNAPTGSTWRVLNSGYGTGLRTFVKQ